MLQWWHVWQSVLSLKNGGWDVVIYAYIIIHHYTYISLLHLSHITLSHAMKSAQGCGRGMWSMYLCNRKNLLCLEGDHFGKLISACKVLEKCYKDIPSMKFRTDFALYATSLKSLNYDGFYTLCRRPGGLSSIHATLYFIFSSRLFNKKILKPFNVP